MKLDWIAEISVIALLILLVPATAHQPFFEEKDFSANLPGLIKDPTVSTAMYSTLETPDDVDYYSFNGSIGQSIMLSITIPQIPGQENFTPNMALIGPGLPSGDLSKNAAIANPNDYGVLVLPSPANATPFFEPFSRTSYWTRQEVYVKLPANGSYSVAIWDDRGQVGRYVFVIGDREVLGGDLAFPLKMKDYWKPIDQPISGNPPGYSQANRTSAEQGGQKPMAQPGLGIIISLPSMAAAAFILLKKRIG